MAGSQQRTYTDFSGGQNNYLGPQASPIIVDDGQNQALQFAHLSQNWWMAEYGLIKYAGDASVLTSALSGTPVMTGVYDWKGNLIICGGGAVYTVSGPTASQIYTGATAGKFYQFTPWDNGAGTEIVIMCNGTDTPLYYDGTTCTTITFTDDPNIIWNNAKPQGCMVFRGSVFYWGDPTHPHRVYKPRPGTHDNFDNTELTVDAFDVDAGFGGVLTGMKALTSDLAVIYKERAIRRMAGVNPFGSEVDPIQIQPMIDEFGCVAPRTIVQVGIEQYFLSEDGLRKLKPIFSYGDIDPQQPSYPIQDLVDAINYTPSVVAGACAMYHKPTKQIWLSVPTNASTTNNQLLIHDVITGANHPRMIGDTTASVIALFNRKVYHGDYAGQIYKNGDDYGYHGANITAQWESKWIAHDGLGRVKDYRELHVYMEALGAGDVVFQYSVLKRGMEQLNSSTQSATVGNAWDTALWDTAVWDTGIGNVFKIKNLGKGNALKLRFNNVSNSQLVKIRMVEVFYDVLSTSKG